MTRREFLFGAFGKRTAAAVAAVTLASASTGGVSANPPTPVERVKDKLGRGREIVDRIILGEIPTSPYGKVEMASGEFENKSGLLPHILGAKGGVLVGPDFAAAQGNTKGWQTMYDSGGSIRPFSPVSQEVVRWAGEAHQNCPEGGFAMFSGAQMNLEIGEATLGLPSQGPDHTYIVLVRGWYPDRKKDTPEKNTTVVATGYVPGHMETRMYQARDKTNLAFIDEQHALQAVASALTGNTNGGAEGQTKITVVGYDVNTRGVAVQGFESTEKDYNVALQAIQSGWKLKYSNFTL